MMTNTIMEAVDEDALFSDEELFANGKLFFIQIIKRLTTYLLLCAFLCNVFKPKFLVFFSYQYSNIRFSICLHCVE